MPSATLRLPDGRLINCFRSLRPLDELSYAISSSRCDLSVTDFVRTANPNLRGPEGRGGLIWAEGTQDFRRRFLERANPFDRRKAALAKGQISTSPQLFKPGRKTTTTAMTYCTRPGSEQRISSSNNRGICPLFWHICCMKSAGLGRQGTQGPG